MAGSNSAVASLWHRFDAMLFPRAVAATGLTVRVRGKSESSLVDPNLGFFFLAGNDIDGNPTLDFTDGTTTDSLTLPVARGVRITLRNVRFFSPGTAQEDQEEKLVSGTLLSVTCGTPSSLVVTNGFGDPLTVAFDATLARIINDTSGQRLTTCADLASSTGSKASVESIVKPDGTLVAEEIVTNPQVDVDFNDAELEGFIQTQNCASNNVTVSLTIGRTVTATLSGATQISCENVNNEMNSTCADLTPGSHVELEGVIQSDGSVFAHKVEFEEDEFSADGNVNSTNCSGNPPSFSFTESCGCNAPPPPITVTINPFTNIQVHGQTATCADLSSQFSAHVEGLSQPDGSVAARDVEQPAPNLASAPR
jgi:hypothetical protein